jgi:hypothetical protein
MSLVSNSERLQRIVENGNGACYGIEWALSEVGRLEYKAHYNPQWRIEGVQKKGLKGLYTTESASHSFMPGQGLVGKAFSDQKMLFVQSLQDLSEEAVQAAMFAGDHVEFKRADLAEEFGIHSAIFVPTAKGVLEVGSTDKVVSASGLVPEAVLTAMQSGSEIPVPPKKAGNIVTIDCSIKLRELVEGSTGGCYGIEWALSEAGRLEYRGHYNPQWRIEGVQKKGLKGLYTTESASHYFMPGQGLVGKAFSDQKMLFVQSLQNLSEEAVQNAMFAGDHVEFKRADLAKAFDIHSAIFVPTAKGVLEVGSTDEVVSASDLVPEAVLTAMQNRRRN